ncbi:hypothetical protein K503DRAFT_205210 [Rhizopogon vinicolor AM-OR11-026]|uniref:Uncharacterized protein n=1 Tax=Rhizopogon vinicolor AM-OR11-026 TaxID=1314800 RepID=A0A1B7MZA4_9AGAM|nr:hypothetical protein K503DRAFT_205210 [Rhizopogon vinicolor AM-OR11-026]
MIASVCSTHSCCHVVVDIYLGPKLIITEYVLYAVSVCTSMICIYDAMSQRPLIAGLYAGLCYPDLTFLYLASLFRLAFQTNYQGEMMNRCMAIARYRETHDASGVWAAQLPLPMNEVDAQNYCSQQYAIYFLTSLVFQYFMHAAFTLNMKTAAIFRKMNLLRTPTQDGEKLRCRNAEDEKEDDPLVVL